MRGFFKRNWMPLGAVLALGLTFGLTFGGPLWAESNAPAPSVGAANPTFLTGLQVNTGATQGNWKVGLNGTYNQVIFGGSGAGVIGFTGGGNGDNTLYYDAPTSASHTLRIQQSAVATISATALNIASGSQYQRNGSQITASDLGAGGTLPSTTFPATIIDQRTLTNGAFSTVSATLADVSGLSFSLVAAKKYVCDGFIHFTTAPTVSNGLKLALRTSDTLTVTSLAVFAVAYSGATVPASGSATALGSTAIAATVAMTDVEFRAVINVNVAGTLQVQLAENVASGTVAATADNISWRCQRTT